MKPFFRLMALCSLLVFTALMISSCGGDTENFVQGNGKVTVTVKNNVGTALDNVKIDAHAGSPTGTIAANTITGASGSFDFQLQVGTDYYFTFTDLNAIPRFATPHADPTIIKPLLTSTVTLNEVL